MQMYKCILYTLIFFSSLFLESNTLIILILVLVHVSLIYLVVYRALWLH